MSVSFIFNNLAFFYRIDSVNRALPVLVWGCRDIPISGQSPSKEAMYSDIEKTLKQYYRNRALPVCKECGLTNHNMEGQSTCPDCLTDPYSYD